MNINPVFHNNLYKNFDSKKSNCNVVNKQLASDCFEKSTNIRFGSLQNEKQRQDKVDSFMNDLVIKTNSPKFSIFDVSNSMRKYVKHINVKPMNQAPKELFFSDYLQGLYSAELAYDSSNNCFLVPQKNRNFYIKTETFKEELGNIWVFINAVHEFTHVLQYEDANACQVGIFNNYIDKNKNNIDSAINQINVSVRAVNSIEESIARPFINLLINNENTAYTRMESGLKELLPWLCRKNKTDDFDAFVRDKVNSEIHKLEEENNIVLDRELVYDTTINHFEKEIEAYTNENKAHKHCLGIDSVRALARVELYKKSIDVLKQMKN